MKKINNYLREKVFLITGAGSGIGLATTSMILKGGGKVYAFVRRPESLHQLKTNFKGNLIVIKGDVTKEKDCENFVKKAEAENKSIQALIHCAGVGLRSRAKDTRHGTFKNIMETNFYSMVYLYHAARKIIENSRGSIVAISSIQGKLPLPYRSAYGAAKHALNAYIKSIRLEDDNIHFAILNFGYVNTGFSLNALKGDGSKYMKESDGQKSGMNVNKAAGLIINSIIKKKKEITPAGLKEKFVFFLYNNFPVIYEWLIKKHVKL